MPLLRDNDLVRIDLPAEGEYVMAKRKLSRGDRIRIAQAIFKDGRISAESTLGSVELGAPDVLEAMTFATLDIAVRQLHVRIGEGEFETLDATPEAIRELDGDSIDHLVEQMGKLYPVRSDADRANLSVNGRGSLKARASRPQS